MRFLFILRESLEHVWFGKEGSTEIQFVGGVGDDLTTG